MLKTYFYLLLVFCFTSIGCSKKKAPPAADDNLFEAVPVTKQLFPLINEISGIADSHRNPGYLWAHEDSGNPPSLLLIDRDGKLQKSIPIKGAVNRDWEEMALFQGQVYIGEIGDNAQVASSYRFYRFDEPSLSTDTIYNYDIIHFTYPDGSHDAEAFVIDPVTKDIYIFTKRDSPSRIYRLAYPYQSPATLTKAGQFPYSGIVGAALSNDGNEIFIKTYNKILYYQRKAGQTIEQALQNSYTSLPYIVEPQGEAICLAANNSGYFTISEKAGASSVTMYFYKRR